jgi:hypothetical protein
MKAAAAAETLSIARPAIKGSCPVCAAEFLAGQREILD